MLGTQEKAPAGFSQPGRCRMAHRRALMSRSCVAVFFRILDKSYHPGGCSLSDKLHHLTAAQRISVIVV
jgi:hypothetical protein